MGTCALYMISPESFPREDRVSCLGPCTEHYMCNLQVGLKIMECIWTQHCAVLRYPEICYERRKDVRCWLEYSRALVGFVIYRGSNQGMSKGTVNLAKGL
jgi:hypothetical protein